MDPVVDGLNAEQFEAVTSESGSTLVLAGAGSGKTRVLTSRIAWLLKNGKAKEESILAVTFTNKAAREMKSRISRLLGYQAKNLMVGTFHGISNQILREFGRRIDIDPGFHILDATDQKAMIKRILKELRVDDLRPEQVADWISAVKDGMPHLPDKRMQEIKAAYDIICRKESALDFSDLLIKVNEALSQNRSGIRDHFNKRFTHILVDEFQDTNPQQYDWLHLLKSPSTEIFAVGDDDQSIYSFRGADPSGMQKLGASTIIRLEQNYRSTGNILNTANCVIDNNSGRIGKTLRTSSGDGEPVHLCEFSDGFREADFVAQRIRRMSNEGTPLNQVAVLYRSNHQSGALERSMLKYGVPYVIHSGTRFFERQEVKDAAAYLRLALNNSDDTALSRIVNFPPRGLGARSIEPLEKTAAGLGISMMDAARQDAVDGGKMTGFVDLIDEISMAMDAMDPAGVIEYILDKSGLYAHYSKSKEDDERVHNLEELVRLAERHAQDMPENIGTREALVDFLSTFTLEDAKDDEEEGNHRKRAVTLMTIHASKGLEYDSIFLTGAEEGQLPHKNSLEDNASVEEERRLMYVAITRARRSLFITHAQERHIFGEKTVNNPSRFLDEIPEDLVKKSSFAGRTGVSSVQKKNYPYRRM